MAGSRFAGPGGNLAFSRRALVANEELLMKIFEVAGLQTRVFSWCSYGRHQTVNGGHASRARNAHTRNPERSMSTAIRENPAVVKRPNAEAGATGTNVLLW